MKSRALLFQTITWALAAASLGAFAQSIKITSVPPAGAEGNIRGIVKGVDPSQYGVAVYINVFGTWWTKPTYAEPVTPIAKNGRFTADITTGGDDACSQQVSAYVIPLTYTPPLASGQSSVPSEVVANAVAMATAYRAKGGRTIKFAGYTWEKKDTGNCVWGPGPNYFSAGQVWTDRKGLHLRISKLKGQWLCAEAMLTNSLGYGTYQFHVASYVGGLPDPVVLGLFTYSDDPDYSHREIDVEFSNGPVVGAPDNWQYVVQPYENSGQRLRFAAPGGTTNSIHEFIWSPGRVDYQSYAVGATGQTVLFQSLAITNGVPVSGNEVVHLNLWLYNGSAPGNVKKCEVLVNDFKFTPLLGQ
ncbi:conserved exported hypothetical protein [Verrucomicrobia bacterium]|nr:conserved exported hypothetical protein [Verrucomicrobiota bacterium]